MTILRSGVAAALGFACALLVACGSSGSGLIPLADAGPLRTDFEEVEQAAQSGFGNCSATEAALAKTERDFDALPTSVDAGLRNTLRQGIANLHTRALVACAQTQTTSTSTVKTATTPTTPTTATTTSTTTTTTTTPPPTTTTPPPATTTTPGGGTAAPGDETPPGNGPGNGNGNGEGEGVGRGGGVPPGQEGNH